MTDTTQAILDRIPRPTKQRPIVARSNWLAWSSPSVLPHGRSPEQEQVGLVAANDNPFSSRFRQAVAAIALLLVGCAIGYLLHDATQVVPGVAGWLLGLTGAEVGKHSV